MSLFFLPGLLALQARARQAPSAAVVTPPDKDDKRQ